MSWNKRDFILQAYEELGYADYDFELQPEQMQRALRRLESMMGTWNAKGVRVGYPFEECPDLDTLTNVPDSAQEAVYLALAIRLAPTLGKVVSSDTRSASKQAYDTMLIKLTQPGQREWPDTLPVGAGNKPWRNTRDPFFTGPADNLEAGTDADIDF